MNLYTRILPIVKDISPFSRASMFFSLHRLSGFLITEQYFRIVSSLFLTVNPLSELFLAIYAFSARLLSLNMSFIHTFLIFDRRNINDRIFGCQLENVLDSRRNHPVNQYFHYYSLPRPPRNSSLSLVFPILSSNFSIASDFFALRNHPKNSVYIPK